MFSTSMRKCSAVVCIPALTRLPAELLSNVLPSMLLVMVTLFFSSTTTFSMPSITHRLVFTTTKCRHGDYVSSPPENGSGQFRFGTIPNFLEYLRFTLAVSQHCCYETQGLM